jgi:hypothetical protein
MHLYFVNITEHARLIKIGCFFFMALVASTVQKQENYEYNSNTTNTSRTINLAGHAFYFVTQTSLEKILKIHSHRKS